jgi:hypothetical protein
MYLASLSEDSGFEGSIVKYSMMEHKTRKKEELRKKTHSRARNSHSSPNPVDPAFLGVRPLSSGGLIRSELRLFFPSPGDLRVRLMMFVRSTVFNLLYTALT